MNYIFDICLNFNKELIDFYEWNESDNLEYFLKIPIIKIEDEIINSFIFHDVKVSNTLLKKIYNKSQKYNKKTVKNDKYACIFSSNKKVVAIKFDEDGNSELKSYLSLEEETEVLEFSKFIKYSIIDYKINRKKSLKTNYYTREENANIKILTKYLNSLLHNKKYNELEYIYYEIFNEKSNNYNIIKQKIINVINNSDYKRNKLLDLYKIVCN